MVIIMLCSKFKVTISSRFSVGFRTRIVLIVSCRLRVWLELGLQLGLDVKLQLYLYEG